MRTHFRQQQRGALWLLAAALCFYVHCAAGDLQVDTQWISDSPQEDAAASNPQALSSVLAQSMGGVYNAAGLPADLGAAASVDGQIVGAPTAAPPPATTTTSAPPPPTSPKTTAAAPPPPPGATTTEGDSGGGSAILVASLVVGAVGLVGVVAWAMMARGKSSSSKEAPAVIPARIAPPPSYVPGPQPEPTAPPAYYPPAAPPAYYAPPPQPPAYYAPQPQQQPPAPQPVPSYCAPPPPVYYASPAPPPPRKVFRIVMRQ